MESIVIPEEMSMLIVGIEEIIKGVLKRHVGLEDNIVGHEVSAPEVTNNDGVVPELGPFKQAGVLVKDVTFFEGKGSRGVGARHFHEGLIKVIGVIDITFESHESFERVTKDFRMSESISNVVVSLVIRSSNIVFVSLIVMEFIGNGTVSKLLWPFNINVGHFRCLRSKNLQKKERKNKRK